MNEQNAAAIAMVMALPSEGRGNLLPQIYAAMGRYNEAADALLAMNSGLILRGMVEEAARLLRTAPAKAASPQTLPRLGVLEFVYLYIGASNRVLEFDEGNVEAGYSASAITAFLWHPSYATVRKTEHFKAFVRKAGLVDYWRAKGWPQWCHPTTATDFVCE